MTELEETTPAVCLPPRSFPDLIASTNSQATELIGSCCSWFSDHEQKLKDGADLRLPPSVLRVHSSFPSL